MTTWKLYFQTGAAEHKAVIKEGGEEIIPSLVTHLSIFDIKEVTGPEVYALNTKQMIYKAQMADFWRATAKLSSSKMPIDAMICAVNPSAGFPHDFPTVSIKLIPQIH